MGILVVIPIAAAIALLDRKRIENFFFLAIGIIVLFILISGYALGNTIPGVYLGVGVGAVSVVYCLIMFFRDRERFNEFVLTPGLICTVICVVFSAFFLVNKTDLGTDYDTYWTHAPQVLNMYRYSDMGNIGRRSTVFTLLYVTPTYTAWCYFCNRLWFGYSDGINLWAWQIFVMTALAPFFSVVKKHEWKRIVLLSILFCLIQGLVGFSYGTPYDFMPDIPMGATIIYGTIMFIKLFREMDRYNNAGYLIGGGVCILLTYLMKRMGGLYTFAIIGVVVIYTMDRLLIKEAEQSFFRKVMPLLGIVLFTLCSLFSISYRNKYFYRDILTTVVPFASLIAFTVMGIYCGFLKILFNRKKILIGISAITFFYCFVLYSVLKVAEIVRMKIIRLDLGESRAVFFKFFSYCFTGEYAMGQRFGNGWVISDFAFILMLMLVMLVIKYLVANNKLLYNGTVSDLDNTIITVFTGYTVYMLLYCFLYTMRQADYTPNGLIGYNIRYLGPAVMLVTAVVLYEILNIQGKIADTMLAFMLMFLILLLPYNPFKILTLDDKIGWDTYNEMYEEAGVELTEDDNVLCIGHQHMYYYVFPAKGTLEESADHADTEPDVWADQVREGDYDYLIIEDYYSSDFPETYQDMFDGGIDSIKKMAIYSVEVSDDKVVFVPLSPM